MEALYQSFLDIPVDAIRFQGLIQMILISGALIFNFVIRAPEKKIEKY
jgi:hypothetical protein